jgi:zinc protease
MKVVFLENHEVPLFSVQLVLEVGAFLDPEGQEGLASAAFDMLNEGAADMDASEISRRLRQMGSSVNSGAGLDGASISASGLVKHMDATLDIWRAVVREPTFPEQDWSVLQKRTLANLESERSDPNSVASRVLYKILYDSAYAGRDPSLMSVSSLDTGMMRAFYEHHVGPANGMLLVGGDVTATQVLPLLEAKMGDWSSEAVPVSASGAPKAIDSSVMYFIDEPGASQSVIRTAQVVGTRLDEDHFEFEMASRSFGGSFVARINMNLREDKGYTYGARCSSSYRHGPGTWGCSTSVRADATGASLMEIQREMSEALGQADTSRPLEDQEVSDAKDSVVYAYPARFETTGSLLGQQVSIQRYDLPEDWVGTYVDKVRSVTTEAANDAFRTHVDPDHMIWLVVGDRASVFEEVAALGLPMVELDREGEPLGD